MSRIAALILAMAVPAFAQVTPEKPAAPPGPLKLTAAIDRADGKYKVGEELQVEVRLENTGETQMDVPELAYQEGSVTFNVGALWAADAGKQKKDYRLSIVRPDPQVSSRMLPARIALGAKKSLILVRRIPAIGAGEFSLTAHYQMGLEDLAAAAVPFTVAASEKGGRLVAVVETEKQGTFSFELNPMEAPRNVTNFVELVRRGFYKDMPIFRVIKSNWIQTGCPYGLGIGGPGYAVEAETDQALQHGEGIVSMAGFESSGHHGSQFFICLARLPALDKKFTIIGKVPADKMQVVRDISKTDVDKNTERPKTDVRIKNITIDVQP